MARRPAEDATLPSTELADMSSGVGFASPPLTLEEMTEIALKSLSWVPIDGFDQRPKGADLSNKRFEVLQRPAKYGLENDSFDGWSGWSYWPNDERIEASWTYSQFISYEMRHFGQLVFPSEICSTGKNPFLFFRTIGGFRNSEPQISEEILIGIGYLGDGMTSNFEWHESKISPPEARTLSQNLMVRLTGELINWPNGHSIICGRSGHQYSNGAGQNEKVYAIFCGNNLKFEFFDENSGRILAANCSG